MDKHEHDEYGDREKKLDVFHILNGVLVKQEI